MFKNIRKLTAVLLAMVMILSTMTTVFAEEVQAEGTQASGNAITEQAEDVTARVGETATFTVTAQGKIRSYQWQVSKDGGKKWKKLDAKEATLTVQASKEMDGYLYRCAVTFKNYKVAYSEPARLTIGSPAVTMTSEAVNGVTVQIEAPENALPEGATMEVGSVSLAAVQNAIDNAAEFDGKVLAAVDITFFDEDGKVIEPKSDIKVTMTSEEIAKAAHPVVVHIPASAEEIEKAVATPEKVEAEFELNQVVFEADQFSVYAVLDPGDEGEEARATVNFYGITKEGTAVSFNDDDPVKTFYVKNRDLYLGEGERDPEESYVDDFVYDPGLGTTLPDSGYLFAGWYIAAKNTTTKNFDTTTKGKTIDQVRKYLGDLEDIVEGDVINIYAIVFKVFSVTYLDENEISLGTDDVYLMLGQTSASYKVSKTYTPTDPTKNFEGWKTDDDDMISNASMPEPYKIDTTMTIFGNITFTVDAPKGRWLVFNENGKGATYVAPQFVKNGETTKPPTLTMTRLGYDFVGWYTVQYGDIPNK